MGWNSKYWDILNQLYWTPKYLGLRSIKKDLWQVEGDRVSIPIDELISGASLYTRKLRIADLRDDLLGKEEILNHVFDLTFGIAPDELLRHAFLTPLGIDDLGPFESLGGEVAKRYGWGDSDNVTQQDGLFISSNSAVAVEIKLASKSSPEQILKYAALLTWEELATGRRDNLGLLYIIPQDALQTHWSNCGLAGAEVASDFLDRSWKRPLPANIRKFVDKHRDDVAGVLGRLKLGVMSWADFRARLAGFSEQVGGANAGDQTLRRLISGFISQIDMHRSTGLSDYDPT